MLEERSDGFAKVAARESDDPVTASLGGQLGGVRADQLPREYLDVLSALQPGEVSLPFRTRWGFHIIRRDPVPAQQIVAGTRFVISYDQSGSGGERSRQEALRLADELIGQVRARKTIFESLVMKYSSNESRSVATVGVWFIRDPGFDPLVVAALARTKIGDVAAPVDSYWGVQVVRRDPVSVEQVLAMDGIRIRFGERIERSQEETKALAADALRRLRSGKSTFDELKREYCCTVPEMWRRGHGLAKLTAAVESLQFGDVADEATIDNSSFVIPRRLDPLQLQNENSIAFELPSPERPDLTAIVLNSSPRALAAEIRMLKMTLQSRVDIAKDARSNACTALENLAKRIETEEVAEKRLALVKSLRTDLRDKLGGPAYDAISSFVDEYAAEKLLTQP